MPCSAADSARQHAVGRPEVPRLAQRLVGMRDVATWMAARRVELRLGGARVSGDEPSVRRCLEIMGDECAFLREQLRAAAEQAGEDASGDGGRSSERHASVERQEILNRPGRSVQDSKDTRAIAVTSSGSPASPAATTGCAHRSPRRWRW